MSQPVITPEFARAMDMVRDGRDVFITGRAGTGKSTLLSLIRDLELGRSRAVVAPTGVAALNVVGETIHSFFRFRPSDSPELRKYRPPAHLDDLDMLIIDEISMARADLVDMMDTALRRRRRTSAPFGGLQLVLVGDLYQLPPVVTDDDAGSVLLDYHSPFFFAAKALRELPLETVQLSEIFRQQDDRFIRLLNAVREGRATEADLADLNTRVDPARAERPGAGAVTLTTTNRAADRVNRAMLEQLAGPVFTSTASVTGEFDASQYRAEMHLSFAVGAQVMMLVNEREYVNGSIGRIVDVATEGDSFRVTIQLAATGEVVDVRPRCWEIHRPVRRDGQVESELVGSFTQLPFRLAWAVTVHKSQGKTFDDVVFDRGNRVFAPGQLYVALSRCTSLDGLTLKRPLRPRDVITDPSVRRFHLQATTEPVHQGTMPRSFVGYVDTGGGEHNGLAELAIIRETPSGEHVTVTTLVNPMRDVGDAAETGIAPSEVAAALSVPELRGYLATLLTGTVIVTCGLSELNRMLGWHGAGIDEGLGVDVRERGLLAAHGAAAPALDRAREVLRAATKIDDQYLPMMPLTSTAATAEPGTYLLPRDGHSDLPRLLDLIDSLPLDAASRLALMLGLAPASRDTLPMLVDRLRRFVGDHGLPSSLLDTAAAQLVEAILAAIGRNGTVTRGEATIVDTVADAFHVPFDRSRLVTDAAQITPTPGMRVCFTGSPPSGAEHAHLSKEHLRRAAEAAGLRETANVSKTKCDLVVANDPSSMSGKARKARELGKPILAAAEFLSMLEEPGEPTQLSDGPVAQHHQAG
ncbi:AAA family ATPase [Haloechinothrix sp. LS1_15]|uniref:AAA family ATPase n=1 Tax=Haloechinothrix sp. LS1_15 TaxID=2652248 RepID=UPI00294445BC|nr:AAA family ATPase [Haloechinothrix sp. LS1_15]MDV6012544.1 AAA family ATPase [Haloechinothrix sp. LS1_15]